MERTTDPTPTEILHECLVIRSNWSAAEKRRRKVGARREWRPQVFPESATLPATTYSPGQKGGEA